MKHSCVRAMGLTLFVCALLAWVPARAIDRIPETSGFTGFANLGGTFWNVSSNLFVGGAPIVWDDVGDRRIDSIFAAPSAIRD